MNENYKKKIDDCGESLYLVSQKTGIPYSTLSELYHEKTNINKTAAETVYLLSLYFTCPVSELLNSFQLIKNKSGKYRGVKYKWVENGDLELHICDRDIEKIIDRDSFCLEKFYSYYQLITETVIDAYLEQQEAERLLYG